MARPGGQGQSDSGSLSPLQEVVLPLFDTHTDRIQGRVVLDITDHIQEAVRIAGRQARDSQAVVVAAVVTVEGPGESRGLGTVVGGSLEEVGESVGECLAAEADWPEQQFSAGVSNMSWYMYFLTDLV